MAGGGAVGRIAGFASNLALTRLLGPADLGLFSLVTQTIQLADTMASAGADYAVNYELGATVAPLETRRGQRLIQALGQLSVLMTLVFMVGLALWLGPWQGLFPQGLSAISRGFYIGLLMALVALEGLASAPWESLLVSRQTKKFAWRQGVFLPLRMLFAALGAFIAAVPGAMVGWLLAALIQALWLGWMVGPLLNPGVLWRSWSSRQYHVIVLLLKRGWPFFANTFLGSLIFYPLILQVAVQGGVGEVGYFRVGQIVQQLFAFLPATLSPLLLLHLRSEEGLRRRVQVVERPLALLWVLMLFTFFLYLSFDHWLVVNLFGSSYMAAILPTRVLLLTALIESLLQLYGQPLLASGWMVGYFRLLTCVGFVAAAWGWWMIPAYGLGGYLLARLVYVFMPLMVCLRLLILEGLDPYPLLLPAALTIMSILVCFFQLLLPGSGLGLVGGSEPMMALLACAVLLMSISLQDRRFLFSLIRNRA